jgi:hypothetical protein
MTTVGWCDLAWSQKKLRTLLEIIHNVNIWYHPHKTLLRLRMHGATLPLPWYIFMAEHLIKCLAKHRGNFTLPYLSHSTPPPHKGTALLLKLLTIPFLSFLQRDVWLIKKKVYHSDLKIILSMPLADCTHLHYTLNRRINITTRNGHVSLSQIFSVPSVVSFPVESQNFLFRAGTIIEFAQFSHIRYCFLCWDSSTSKVSG